MAKKQIWEGPWLPAPDPTMAVFTTCWSRCGCQGHQGGDSTPLLPHYLPVASNMGRMYPASKKNTVGELGRIQSTGHRARWGVTEAPGAPA